MRLVCPNCDAEYEIEASAIPETGRDVQCSNCGTAWFQPSPTHAAAMADEAALFDAPFETAPPPRDEMTPTAEAPIPADMVPADMVPADMVPTDPVPEHRVQPKALDEALVAVLRQEAEREAAARRAEAGQPIEMQTEMGLTPASTAPLATALHATPSPAERHIARLKGVDPEPRPVPRPQTRREMLPAIEEINSTLRATSEKRTGEPAAIADSLDRAQGSANGFRNGFVLMLLLAAILVFAYAMAPRIGQQIPGLDPALTGYVATIDTARLWLDGMMQQAVSVLHGLAGDPSS